MAQTRQRKCHQDFSESICMRRWKISFSSCINCNRKHIQAEIVWNHLLLLRFNLRWTYWKSKRNRWAEKSCAFDARKSLRETNWCHCQSSKVHTRAMRFCNMENGKRFYRLSLCNWKQFLSTYEREIRLSLSGFTVECILLVKCALCTSQKQQLTILLSPLLLAFANHKAP